MARRRRPPAASSRERLLDAARQEFAARGFDGAKVDRIAARARLNKAMLYYHFDSKAALYRHILRDLFRDIGAAVDAAETEPGTPESRLRRFIETLASHGVSRPHFPAIWLREMADGGRHLDASIVRELQRIIATLARILDEGRRARRFRAADPFVTHLNIVAPLLFFAASAPARARIRQIGPAAVDPPPEQVIAYVQQATLAVLSSAHASGRTVPRSSR